MKTRHIALLSMLTALGIMLSTAQAQSGLPSANVPITQMKFAASGIKDEGHRELLVGPAYGDLANGPHGTFVRMPAGFSSHVHTHTGNYWGVVIAGVAANGKPGSPDVPLPTGSYWFQKGGERHVTKCLSGNECLFFISQGSKFDYVLEKPTR